MCCPYRPHFAVSYCTQLPRPLLLFSVEVTVTRRVSVIVRCPCSHICKLKVRVGTYGNLCKGLTQCLHCEASPARDGWPSLAEYWEPLSTNRCQTGRGVDPIQPSSTAQIGPLIVEQVNKLTNLTYKKISKFYRCCKCCSDDI